MRRWIKRIVLGVFALVLLGIGGFLIFLHTDTGRAWLRGQIVAGAKASFPGGFRIGRVTGSVFSELVAEDIEIDALDGRPMLRAPRLALDLRLGPLLHHRLELARVVIEDPVVYPLRPAVAPTPETTDEASWSIELGAIDIHRGRLELDGVAALDAVELRDATLAVPADGPLRAKGAIAATWRERAVPIAGRIELSVGAAPVVEDLDATIGAVAIAAKDLVIDRAGPTGTLEVTATAAALRRLEPRAELPGDARISITATRAGAETALALDGAFAGKPVTGRLLADLAAQRVRGVISATDVELGPVTRGAVAGRGSATVALVADRARVRGTVIASGALATAPPATAVIGFDAALDAELRLVRATGLAFVSGAGDAQVRAVGAVARDSSGVLAVTSARAVASTTRLGTAIASRVPVDGAVTVAADARGPLEALRVTARADARNLSYAGDPVGRATATAELHGTALWASVVAFPAAAPIVIAADGSLTGREIALGAHRITLPSGEAWAGRGGRVTLGETAIAVRGLRSANRAGTVAVDATYGTATADLALELDAHDVDATAIDPAYRGTASGTVALARRGARWTGHANVAARGFAIAPERPALDADATVAVDGRRITVGASAAAPGVGKVSISVDADGPPVLTDGPAWRALERSALRETVIALDHIDLGAAGVPTGGTVHGSVTIAGAGTKGTLTVAAIHTPVGDVDGDILFRQEASAELGAAWAAHVVGLGDADVAARIALPLHPFDPAAWRTLGRGALSSLSAKLADVSIDPKKLAALGITAPYRGTANVAVTVERGSTYAKVEAELAGVTGGALVQPLDLRVVGETDERGTHGSVRLTAPRQPAPLQLLAVDAALPVTFDRWLFAPRQAIYAPVTGTLAIPELAAAQVLALVGRTDLTGGTLGGQLAIAGTLGTPTARGTLRARDIAIVDRIEHRTIPKLEQLAIEIVWGGVAGSVVVTGSEARAPTEPPRTLFASLAGRPTEPSTLVGHLDIKHFDLIPIAAFLPGPLVAAQGTLDANLTLRGVSGFDAVRGTVTLADARVPLHPSIGTLRRIAATLALTDTGLDVKVTGALGGGTIALTAKSPGHELAVVTTELTLAKVSPIGDLEPVIRGVIGGTFRRSPANQWSGILELRDGSIDLPPVSGEALLVAEAPPDLYFLDGGGAPKAPVFALGGRPPDRPWLVVDLEFGRRGKPGIKITAEDLYDTRGELSGKLTFAVGDSLGIDGRIDIVRGDVGDLVGRSYRAEGALIFDGTTDPTIDVTLSHAFPEMVLTAHLGGRLSNPDPPTFGGDPIYTQDQLAGFFLGGEPGGDPASQTRELATGATASILSTKLGRRVRKALPVKLSLLRCEPGSSAVGASCSAGRWFGDKLFVTGKYRLVARPDENTGEVQVQYYLQRELLLEGVGGDGNHDGVDLLWRRRW